jgi:23S rRNA (guanosine2251-2'-O)-methyltransferase
MAERDDYQQRRRERPGGDRRPDRRAGSGRGERPGERPRREGGWQERPRREGGWQERPRREERGEERPARDAWQERPRREDWQERPRREGGWQDRPQRAPARPSPDRQPARPAHEELVGADNELVAGRHPVQEAFAARREAVRLLVVPERRAALDALVLHATTLRIPIVEVEGGTLTSLCGFDGHQGVALVATPRRPAGVDDVLARARDRGEAPFVLVLDSLEDPQNLGTLLRSAEACGVHGVFFPTRRAAPLSPAAIKASAGATEHLLLVPVENLGGALADLRSHGLRLIGSDEGAPLLYGEADLRGPLALVVGSEGRGISGALRRRLDMLVRIPMRGRVASLNAAVAGSVLLFTAADQRGVPEADEVDGRQGAVSPAEPVPDKPAAAKRRRSAKPAAEPQASDEGELSADEQPSERQES